MRKAKTNLKRVLSMLLVTAMVLTGNVFSGLEVKAAEMTGETVEDFIGDRDYTVKFENNTLRRRNTGKRGMGTKSKKERNFKPLFFV